MVIELNLIVEVCVVNFSDPAVPNTAPVVPNGGGTTAVPVVRADDE